MWAVEDTLVQICIQMGKIRQPLTGPQAIKTFNPLIKNTPMQDTLREFQQIRSPNSKTLGAVGIHWWQGFKRRNTDKIVTKRGEKFVSARADWTKKSNLSQMYDVIYDVMVKARIASETPKPVFTDRGGNKLERSE